MNIVVSDNDVVVKLSERNVRYLIQAFESDEVLPTLRKKSEDGKPYYVVIENDLTHYRGRDAGPELQALLEKLVPKTTRRRQNHSEQ